MDCYKRVVTATGILEFLPEGPGTGFLQKKRVPGGLLGAPDGPRQTNSTGRDAGHHRKIRAAQIMHTPVLSVQPQDAISRAVDFFEKHNISQLPVIERGIPVGCISEAAIVKAIEQQRLHKTHLLTVRDFMESGFPMVPPDMDVETVINILQQNHAVLVVEGKAAKGVITKHDLISLIL